MLEPTQDGCQRAKHRDGDAYEDFSAITQGGTWLSNNVHVDQPAAKRTNQSVTSALNGIATTSASSP